MSQKSHDNDNDLVEILNILWRERRIIIIVTTISALIGLVLAFTSPKEYQVTARLMPEYTAESQGGASSLLRQFGGLAGLAGSSYNSNSNAMRVELYPEIVRTLPFQKQLMEHPFRFSMGDSLVTLYEYFVDKQQPGLVSRVLKWTISLPGRTFALFSPEGERIRHVIHVSDGVVHLSSSQLIVAYTLQKRVAASLDVKSGIVTISVYLPDPVLAANVGQFVIEQLTDYLVQYRTEKYQRDLAFTNERLEEVRKRYENAGYAFSAFRESAQGTPTSRARQGEQFLQSEYELAFAVYNNLTQQLEQQKLKLQEETPMFKILQPIYLPERPASPRKLIILVIGTMVGFFLSSTIVFLRSRTIKLR